MSELDCSDLRRRRVSLVVCALLLFACVLFGGYGSAFAASSAGRWTFSRMRPVSSPVAVGGRFVVYVASRQRLMIVGLDARSGKPAWMFPATPSASTPGVGPSVLAIGNRVIFMETAAGVSARLVAVDAVSGRLLWASRAAVFSDWPEPCVGDPRGACDIGFLVSVLPFPAARLLRFGVTDGRATVGSALPGSLASARGLASGLYDPGLRHPEYLVSASATRVLWTRRLADIFDLAGASTDNSWDIDRIDRDGLFVGSVGAPAQTTRSGLSVYDVSAAETVGFRMADGSVVWSNAGSQYGCDLLPCPGWLSQGGLRVGVRLRETGTLTFRGGGGNGIVAPGDDVTIEGFDPATGNTLWTFDAGDDAGLIAATEVPPQTRATVVVLPNAKVIPNLVDLISGHAMPATGPVEAWCEPLTTTYDLGSLGQYTAAAASFACDAEGHRIRTPGRIPSFVGPSIRGVTAWSDVNQVVAAPSG